MRTKENIIDLTNFFRYCGIDCSGISIKEKTGMYPFNPDPEANWIFYAFAGYLYLKEKKLIDLPKKVACVAVGSGAEAIGLKKIFPDLASITITDIDSEVVFGAFTNVENATPESIGNVIPLVGSLCDPLVKLGFKFDLIHGNVPNLVCSDERDLSLGDDKGTFIKTGILTESIPKEYLEWALGTQYLFLKGGSSLLGKNGSIITMMGGRFRLSILEKLFSDCGLRLEPEFSTGFKFQTQPEPDYEGYAKLEEEHGVSFDFFRYFDSKKLLIQEGIGNPTHDYSGQQIKDLLKDFRVSSSEALELHKKGIVCGHTIHMFRGTKV